MQEQDRKRVLITGAARGIGAAIAERFIKDGYDVILNHRRSRGKGAANIGRLTGLAEHRGTRATPALADIAEPADLDRMVEQLTRAGIDRVDHLILNAASAPFKFFREMTERDWKALLGTNLIGNVNCVTRLTPLMPRGSTICALSSAGSHKVMVKYPLGVMKAALENLVRYLEVELYPQDIRVNGICAGLVNTDMYPVLMKLWGEPFANARALSEEASAYLPFTRPVVEPEEVASIVAFLASQESSAIRGQILHVDRGCHL